MQQWEKKFYFSKTFLVKETKFQHLEANFLLRNCILQNYQWFFSSNMPLMQKSLRFDDIFCNLISCTSLFTRLSIGQKNLFTLFVNYLRTSVSIRYDMFISLVHYLNFYLTPTTRYMNILIIDVTFSLIHCVHKPISIT